MNSVYLLTGGNMGNRINHLEQALQLLATSAGHIIKTSPIYETSAWGITNQPAFLNQAVLLNTLLTPEDLLQEILSIELKMGRVRIEKMGPRIIDIDILFYNNVVIHTEDLIIPHPQLHLRRFVLVPLVEIAPTIIHPVLHKTIVQLLEECPDVLPVTPFILKSSRNI